MATGGDKSSLLADPSTEDFEEEPPEVKTVPVFEIDGEVYQEFRKPTTDDDWDLSLMWRRHTVSSKAKDWGVLRARQSRPIPSLYRRSRNYESVPAFRQFDSEELNAAIVRIQKPTKSAKRRSRQDNEAHDEADVKDDGDSKRPPPISSEQQQSLVERLLQPTASQARRVKLTLKYRPKTQEQQ